MTTDRDAVVAQALVEELCRKSAMLWLRPAGAARAQAVWHAWVDGAPHVVSGGLEQSLPTLPGGLELADGTETDVTVRSKDTGGRVVTFRAVITTVLPGTEAYAVVATELHGKRLNASDGEEQPARWVRESRIVRLQPTGARSEGPGHVSHRSHAAEPPGSPAATRATLPFVLGRRATRRR